MLTLLADRGEFAGLAVPPQVLWPAFESGSAASLDAILSDLLPQNPSGPPPLRVDFAVGRGNYEVRIFTEGVLPVRKNSLHDLFNVLAWRTFPHSKRAINRIHMEAMATELPGKRGPRRDFLTLVDEAGVIVLVDDQSAAFWLAGEIRRIRQGDPHAYPGEIKRVLSAANARLSIFGHALFESLVLRPETLLKVGAFAVLLGASQEDSPDARLAEYLASNSAGLHPSHFPSLRLDVIFDAVGMQAEKQAVSDVGPIEISK